MSLKLLLLDGNCLFHALGWSVSIPASEVRTLAANELASHTDEYVAFEHAELDVAFFAELIRNKVWGNGLCIAALCNAWHICVEVLSPDLNLQTFRPSAWADVDDVSLLPTHSVFFDGIEHYDALLLDEP